MSDQAGHREDDDRALAGEFALGLLDANQHQAFAARLLDEPALRAELAVWRSRLASLDKDFEEVAAPGHILAKIETRLFGKPKSATAPIWESLAFWRSLAAGSLAVAALAVGFSLTRPDQLDPQEYAAELVAALDQEGSDVKFIALYNQTTGAVRLTALSGAEVPDRDFELWFIEGSDSPVSMGVVPINARSEIDLTAEAKAKIKAGTVLAVTLEPKGGSPTGAPTGALVAKGAATLI